jgi:hypothetical protein
MRPDFADALLGINKYIETITDAMVAPSVIHGLGLFTTRARMQGDELCRLDGQEIDPARWPQILHSLEWNAITPERLLVRALRTSYGYINHSTAPNLSIDPSGRSVFALCDIAPDRELLLDYTKQPLPGAYLADARAAYLRGG